MCGFWKTRTTGIEDGEFLPSFHLVEDRWRNREIGYGYSRANGIAERIHASGNFPDLDSTTRRGRSLRRALILFLARLEFFRHSIPRFSSLPRFYFPRDSASINCTHAIRYFFQDNYTTLIVEAFEASKLTNLPVRQSNRIFDNFQSTKSFYRSTYQRYLFE